MIVILSLLRVSFGISILLTRQLQNDRQEAVHVILAKHELFKPSKIRH